MSYKLLGVKISNYSWPETLKIVEKFFVASGLKLIFTPNPEMLVLASQDDEFLDTLNGGDLNIADGFGLILAAKLSGLKPVGRITGVDLLQDIIALAADKKYKIYLLGGLNNVAGRLADKLQRQYPGLLVGSGGDNLSPGPQTDDQILRDIKNFAPDFLAVAFGHGQQEKWLKKYQTQLAGVKVAMGVGGSFDFLVGDVRRAPRLMRRIGLEWLWRLILQPRRLKRIFTATCRFSYLVVKYRYSYVWSKK